MNTHSTREKTLTQHAVLRCYIHQLLKYIELLLLGCGVLYLFVLQQTMKIFLIFFFIIICISLKAKPNTFLFKINIFIQYTRATHVFKEGYSPTSCHLSQVRQPIFNSMVPCACTILVCFVCTQLKITNGSKKNTALLPLSHS